jgi:GrpB-like predicted nucleotidyltransferase (UPF0157 family)
VRRDPIVIEPYDDGWTEQFEHQRSQIEPAVRPWLSGPLEHIGSTAVPGLAAKPIIDMLALTPSYEGFHDALPELLRLGWVLAPEPGDEISRKFSLCYPNTEHRSHHLHVVEASSTDWPDWIAFRDHLRSHPETAARYASLKIQLANLDATDRPRYRRAKAPFIDEVLSHSRR